MRGKGLDRDAAQVQLQQPAASAIVSHSCSQQPWPWILTRYSAILQPLIGSVGPEVLS
jgi:hypothetical protein